jgi:hypothetical protein
MSKPRGTLNQMVGCTSARLASVFSMRPGAGRPSSTTSVPPLRSTMCRLWLAPKVWLQGSQSTSTGFSCARKRQACAIICWLAHSMRCVLTTTLGWPVEPDVSRYLAGWSGVMARKACITPGPSSGATSAENGSAPGWVSWARPNTTGQSRPLPATAAPYTAASEA